MNKAKTVLLLIVVVVSLSACIPTVDAYAVVKIPRDLEDSRGNYIRTILRLNVTSLNWWYGNNYSLEISCYPGSSMGAQGRDNFTITIIGVYIALDFGWHGTHVIADELENHEYFSITSTQSSSVCDYHVYTRNFNSILDYNPPIFDGSKQEAELEVALTFRMWTSNDDESYHDQQILAISNFGHIDDPMPSVFEIPVTVNDYSKIDSLLSLLGLLTTSLFAAFILFRFLETRIETIQKLRSYLGVLVLLVSGVLNVVIITTMLGFMTYGSKFSFSYSSRGILIGIFAAAIAGYIITIIRNIRKDYKIESPDLIDYQEFVHLAGIDSKVCVNSEIILEGESPLYYTDNTVEINALRRWTLIQPMTFTLWIESFVFIFFMLFWNVGPLHWSYTIPTILYVLISFGSRKDLQVWQKKQSSRLENWDNVWKLCYSAIANSDVVIAFLDLPSNDEIDEFDETRIQSEIIMLDAFFSEKGIEVDQSLNLDKKNLLKNAYVYKWISDEVIEILDEIDESIKNHEGFIQLLDRYQMIENPWFSTDDIPIEKIAYFLNSARSILPHGEDFFSDAMKLLECYHSDNIFVSNDIRALAFRNRENYWERLKSHSILPPQDEWIALILGITTALGAVIGPFLSEIIATFI